MISAVNGTAHDFFLSMKDKWTALMVAAGNGHVDVVNSLLCIGADIEAKDKVCEGSNCILLNLSYDHYV